MVMQKNFGVAECKDCSIGFVKNGPGQRYCVACSTKRDLDRKRLWARANPQDSEASRRQATARRERIRQIGAKVSREHAEPIHWDASRVVDLSWMVRVSVPFTYNLSKNHIYTQTWHGHTALRKEARTTRDAVTALLRSALVGKPIVQNKVWIDIFVQKSNHKGDAVNVIDLLCDAIKEAVGIDDRWFSIRRLDWQIVKHDPRIFIGVGQEDGGEVHACSTCGRCLSAEHFTKNRKNKSGLNRVCRECRVIERGHTPVSISTAAEGKGTGE